MFDAYMNNFFQERFRQFNTEYLKQKKLSNTLSTYRLICFLLLIISFVLLASTGFYVFIVFAITLFVGFLFLVAKHSKVDDQTNFYQNLSIINQNEVDALNFELDNFESGEEFIDSGHNYTFDLDFFGPYSIFQYLNRTTTKSGKSVLAALLSNPLSDKQLILEKQEALKELSEKIDFRQNFKAYGMFFEEGENEEKLLTKWLQTKPYFLGVAWVNIARFLLPLLFFASAFYSFVDGRFGGLAALFFFINLGVVGIKVANSNEVQNILSSKFSLLKKYIKLIQCIENETFENPLLNKIKNTCKAGNSEIKSLSKIVSKIDQRLNLLVAIFFNAFFLYDFHVLITAEKWKEKNKDAIENWFSALHQIDALNSLANYNFCHPYFNFPIINEANNVIDIQFLKHPLIKNEDCISNHVQIGLSEKLIILTGANMSGKSTLLRSVGVNIVMALIGVKVSAKTFSLPIMEVITSMRVTDDIKTQTSYFYAELKRLKKIVNQLESNQPTFVILDEILKGTNSDDKLSGSINLIEKFVQYNCLGIIATHDLELGKLENELPQLVSNKCFESDITNNQLTFDYKLKEGIAKNKNATFLMKQMEIV